jgi:hypothetical protein
MVIEEQQYLPIGSTPFNFCKLPLCLCQLSFNADADGFVFGVFVYTSLVLNS